MLTQSSLSCLDDRVSRPVYDRSAVSVGIAHFGVGGFHRAHQAMYLDRLMDRGLALDWGICAIGSLPRDRRMIDALAAQDGLYTLVVKHADGRREPRVIGSIVEALHAADDPVAVARRLADPALRIVSLTITEGGYGLEPSSPVFGHIVHALALRRAAGVAPFTVVSCDNLPGNGPLTRAVVLAVAEQLDPDLARWIAAEVAFPSSMVDRITPVTTQADIEQLADEYGVHDRWPVVSEAFHQWVLEDEFTVGRPPLEEVGVQLVEDVAPYELMKLRLLNAGHQAVGYLGYLAGHRHVHDVSQDPVFARFLLAYLEREGTPTLAPVPGIDLAAYRRSLVERFANPHVADTLARICTDGSDRIPKFLLPVVRDNLRRGGQVGLSALVAAGWKEYCGAVDGLVDRDRGTLVAAAQEPDDLAFLRQRNLFGDLADDARFASAYLDALRDLRAAGARAAVAAATSSEVG
jgi:mannitol 2-dehydrogenase